MIPISWGGLFGLIFNLFVGAGLWVMLGAVIERVANTFNLMIKLLPTLQDAVNGFYITQTIWSFLLIVIFITLCINYLINENSLSSGEV